MVAEVVAYVICAIARRVGWVTVQDDVDDGEDYSQVSFAESYMDEDADYLGHIGGSNNQRDEEANRKAVRCLHWPCAAPPSTAQLTCSAALAPVASLLPASVRAPTPMMTCSLSCPEPNPAAAASVGAAALAPAAHPILSFSEAAYVCRTTRGQGARGIVQPA